MSPRLASIAALYACGCSVEHNGAPGHICDAHRADLDFAMERARAAFFARLGDDARTFPQILAIEGAA